jgi:hypothetical protein
MQLAAQFYHGLHCNTPRNIMPQFCEDYKRADTFEHKKSLSSITSEDFGNEPLKISANVMSCYVSTKPGTPNLRAEQRLEALRLPL